MFVATKALITFQGKVLVLRESAKNPVGTNADKYDVVGGRMEPGERFDECLIREVKEETGLSIKVGKPFFVNEWRPVVKGESWQIVGIFFECEADTNQVILSQDHDHYKWIDARDYESAELIPNLLSVFEAFVKR